MHNGFGRAKQDAQVAGLAFLGTADFREAPQFIPTEHIGRAGRKTFSATDAFLRVNVFYGHPFASFFWRKTIQPNVNPGKFTSLVSVRFCIQSRYGSQGPSPKAYKTRRMPNKASVIANSMRISLVRRAASPVFLILYAAGSKRLRPRARRLSSQGDSGYNKAVGQARGRARKEES